MSVLKKGIIAACLVFLGCPSSLYAQDGVDHIVMPTINLNTELTAQWRVNMKVQSRFQQRTENQDQLEHALTDLALIASRKIKLSNRLGIGAMLRFREEQQVNRLIQQYTLIRQYTAFRLSHRVAADQTWSERSPLEARFRYRILAQIPLNGHTINSREWYAKIGNEYLQSFTEGSYDLELRLSPTLGFEITDQNKIELGLEYRLDSFVEGESRNRIFWQLIWYASL
ncbi:MAG: DUF2490 domain-containing protein [Saprospiraceae bacterium]|nr:DUF2490 domain-containing protein [Saprospiraceae bacterium]